MSREFHISRQARDRYDFDQMLFSLRGGVILANFHAARVFAQHMNETRDLVRFPEQAVQAGQINAMGLIDEILHHVIALYRQQENPEVMAEAYRWLEERLGAQALEQTLARFLEQFPPPAVYRGGIQPQAYLEGQSEGIPHRQLLLEELLVLWVANANPAFSAFRELFDDAELERETAYHQVVTSLHGFFDEQPAFGPDQENLLDMLRRPAVVVPHSIPGQLEYIREHWAYLLGRYLYRLLSGLDLIQEEHKIGLPGPGPAQVYDYSGLELEPERFSPDQDWMPQLVLLAKNTYVWLDQLSRQYHRAIDRLDQVPDEELDLLARRGYTGLWLIGVWERSPASKRIKHLCGNPKAVASAYSVYDYQIAADLGGQEAFQNLRQRAWRRGIRLASDMVPNHMGIDSRWVIEHPDRFLSLEHSPFPSYSFNGPDLSSVERVGLYLEDHYYDRSDAAVVFKRVDRWTGSERYIYHGNDGTSMPWNDTAQINYLSPEAREAVIQMILHVARQFPIIRFDAAMTLAKRHYQRLWFPEPGSGGAIPTRAEHGLTREAFHTHMPEEFWRQVVDRVAAEVPDTLLLAEAFWLMEGYFVRTLGMHRVYNSAFMNMLRDEDNAKYRTVIKDTLEFDPEILKRFVSFMSNPDEETAVGQFGKGDKYFGICTMMATMPGLPMFGHGQIEGFTEKYGMEYRYAEWQEEPDQALVERHERQIFPLLHRRRLFADVAHFYLYDFFSPEGVVNEDVFAYSNRAGEERSLVVYHNRFATARGWIRTSAGYLDKSRPAEERTLVQKNLGEGLGLNYDPHTYCIFRDHVTGLEYIRPNQELWEQGLFVELQAYKCHVFLDFRQVHDSEWQQYAHLTTYLDGRGVPSIEEALREVLLQPVLIPYRKLVQAGLFERLLEAREEAAPAGALLQEVEGRIRQLLEGIEAASGIVGDRDALAEEMQAKVETALGLPHLETADLSPHVQASLTEHLGDELQQWGALLAWLFTHPLGQLVTPEEAAAQSRSWIDEWLLGKIILQSLRELGLDEGAAQRALLVTKLLTSRQAWYVPQEEGKEIDAGELLESLLRESDVRQFLQINRYKDVLWFNRESFEELRGWLLTAAVIQLSADPGRSPAEQGAAIQAAYTTLLRLQQAQEASDCQVERLLAAL